MNPNSTEAIDLSVHDTKVIRAMQTILEQDPTDFNRMIVQLCNLKKSDVSNLLDSESYQNSKKLEDSQKCLARALKDRNDYYDPLLVPKPNKREMLKLIKSAKYMHAYPAGLESQISEIEEKLPNETHLRGDDYYKDWLGRKLGFSREECAMKTVEEIDREASNNIRAAINFINGHAKLCENIFQNSIGKSSADRFRSVYYKEMHKESSPQDCMTVREYLAKYFEHEKLKTKHEHERSLKPESAQLEHETAIRQLTKAQWEIRRLLALTMRYRDNERTPDAMLHKIDENALVGIVGRLIVQERDFPDIPSGADNQIFAHTVTQYKLWNRNSDGGYTIKDTDIKGADSIDEMFEVDSVRLESAKLRGKLDAGDKNFREKDFELEHLQIRTLKDPNSRLGKSLRKPDAQVLDYTGMIMVLRDYGQLDELLDMLISEFGASYREVLEVVPNEQGNHKKCVLRIPHNFKSLKEQVSKTSEVLADIRQDTTSIRRNKNLNKKLDTLGKTIEPYYEIAAKLERDLYVEVQFLDLPSYISAECDLNSSTHHDVYKERQTVLEIMPILFPTSVYGEKTMSVVYKPEITKKFSLSPTEVAKFRAL